MAFQQSDLDTINGCISSGILETRFADGRTVRYQSLDHMIAARSVIQAELIMAAQAQSGIVRRKFGVFRSGF